MSIKVLASFVLMVICFGVHQTHGQKLKPVLVDFKEVIKDDVWSRWVCFYPDRNQVLFAEYDGDNVGVGLWDLRTSTVQRVVHDSIDGKPIQYISRFAFNHDSSEIIGRSDSSMTIYSTEDWKPIKYIPAYDSLSGLTRPVRDVCYKPDGQSCIGITYWETLQYDRESGEIIQVLHTSGAFKSFVDVSPDGKRVATSTTSGAIFVLDVETGDSLWLSISNYPNSIRPVQFNRSGDRVVINTDRTDTVGTTYAGAIEFNVENGQVMQVMERESNRILSRSARYSPDGSKVIVTADTVAIIFSVESGTTLAVIPYSVDVERRPRRAEWAEFSADGDRVVVGGLAGIGVWDLEPTSSVSEVVLGELAIGLLHPNPADDQLIIPIKLKYPSKIQVAIYDLFGKEVGMFSEGVYEAGAHHLNYDVSGLSVGMYVVKLRAGSSVAQSRVHIIR